MTAVLHLPEQKVILKGVSWETYERLLAEQEGESGTRFAYDSGILEILVPSARHEKPNRILASLVEVLAEEMALNIECLGSTTLKRADLLKGFEPDSCFYIQHAEAIRNNEEVDLTVDPPPDLVIEIDITSPSLDKFPLYAAVGVPEVWRYDGTHVMMYRLAGERYVAVTHSVVLPLLTNEHATRFLEERKQAPSTVWLRAVRAWARDQRTISD
jgi:Uma2 family endonuclease